LPVRFRLPGKAAPDHLLPTQSGLGPTQRRSHRYGRHHRRWCSARFLARRWNLAATRRFFTQDADYGSPTRVSTYRAPTYPRVLAKLLPAIISAAAITNLPPTSIRGTESRTHSPISPTPSELSTAAPNPVHECNNANSALLNLVTGVGPSLWLIWRGAT
jgi:hypothetical protein